jgi:hypothetical protein
VTRTHTHPKVAPPTLDVRLFLESLCRLFHVCGLALLIAASSCADTHAIATDHGSHCPHCPHPPCLCPGNYPPPPPAPPGAGSCNFERLFPSPAPPVLASHIEER